MTNEWAKWNQYEIGKVRFINRTKGYVHRSLFVNFVLEIGASSVLEIGPGELLEYQELKKQKDDIDYSIVEVSKVFLKHCKKNFPEINRYCGSMDDIKKFEFSKAQFDVVYGSSVLEHSPNVVKTIEDAIEVSSYFQFVLFKWKYSGGLESSYKQTRLDRKHKPPGYWSSYFNIYKLMEVMKTYGDIISQKVALNQENKIVDFNQYSKEFNEDNHRNGNYLIITGKRKDA